ncbi:hypothetical protein [Falsirhodobacter sp. alg1]|uniref:hypothetical protein n=1 Tax=Falsirhodobacter sp. alg1 TaxID=1472418 RepID=UPI0005F0BB11|nr:hypothetical protein [Falsirhodobacter sp. alg1]
MSDYRNDDHLRAPPRTVQAERSGSSIFLIVAAVIALLAILWFAFSSPAVEENTAAPAISGQTQSTQPAVPDTTVAPESTTGNSGVTETP